jgi:hypothetical protein
MLRVASENAALFTGTEYGRPALLPDGGWACRGPHRSAPEQLLREPVPGAGRTPPTRKYPHAPTTCPPAPGFGASSARLPSGIIVPVKCMVSYLGIEHKFDI